MGAGTGERTPTHDYPHAAAVSCLCLLPPLQLASARPKLTVRPAQPTVEGGEGESRPARSGGLEGLAATLRIGRQQVLELLLDKFYDKR